MEKGGWGQVSGAEACGKHEVRGWERNGALPSWRCATKIERANYERGEGRAGFSRG